MARWAVLSVVSTFALVGIDRAARLLLPLTTLPQLSIVFPDQAPSRMKIALRRGTAKHLAHEVAVLEDATAQEAAEYLLRVVAELTAHDQLTRGRCERDRSRRPSPARSGQAHSASDSPPALRCCGEPGAPRRIAARWVGSGRSDRCRVGSVLDLAGEDSEQNDEDGNKYDTVLRHVRDRSEPITRCLRDLHH